MLALAMLSCAAVWADAPPQRELAVCADPANLPFSNQRLEGFENRIAQLVADELHAKLRYAWNMQRRGFLRRTLGAGACDLVLGAPVALQGLATTRPYYRSTYVFVSLRERGLAVRDFDDPRLASLSIGLHAVGAEGANTPPAMALARRDLGANVRGYPMWGEDSEEDTPARLIDAVARGDVDIAVVWGPFAGFYAKAHGGRLAITPAEPDAAMPGMPMSYDLAMGVRRGDEALRAEVQAALDRRRSEVASILNEFGVPLLPLAHADAPVAVLATPR
ncbi:MAG TPA: quinoprotein dehydrogenase-associated putative ABC transporter substrate-binding protein [Ideonella sp.]|jgi:quinoprotein dehydrogenase-associated probable ABC transporter substrate-binding protein|nr:quinoprotein dehydrogenase-associated putative ABC transporter substrate-binding protein [Ideonella sp.]